MSSQAAQDRTPKTTIIGPYKYDVEFDPDASYDYNYLGVTLNRSRRLKLAPNQPDTELPATYLHEVLHALGSAYEIEYWRSHKFDDKGVCTDKIDLMSVALLKWMRENAELVCWMINIGREELRTAVESNLETQNGFLTGGNMINLPDPLINQSIRLRKRSYYYGSLRTVRRNFVTSVRDRPDWRCVLQSVCLDRTSTHDHC